MYTDIDKRATSKGLNSAKHLFGGDILASCFTALGVLRKERAKFELNLPPRWRGVPRMLRLQISGEPRCTGCALCENICPSGSIGVLTGGGKATLQIELSTCLQCGLCADVCPSSAITHSPNLAAATETADFTVDSKSIITPFERLKEQADVTGHGQITPEDALKTKLTPTFEEVWDEF